MTILNSGIGNYVIFNTNKYSYFGGNDYLGQANHPDIKNSCIQSIKKYGVNFSASRLTTGTADIHLELEKNNIRPVLFEQPVIKSDLLGMKYVKDHTSVSIAADESVFTSTDAINVIRTSFSRAMVNTYTIGGKK